MPERFQLGSYCRDVGRQALARAGRFGFNPHCHQLRQAQAGLLLPEGSPARGRVRGRWPAGTVGGFSTSHGRSLSAPMAFVFHNIFRGL